MKEWLAGLEPRERIMARSTDGGRTWPVKRLVYDGPNMRFTNSDDANKLINPPAREGWGV